MGRRAAAASVWSGVVGSGTGGTSSAKSLSETRAKERDGDTCLAPSASHWFGSGALERARERARWLARKPTEREGEGEEERERVPA